jgi:hypothetical protein
MQVVKIPERWKRFILIMIILTSPVYSFAQNWMMAQKYLSSALDSIIHINWPNTGKLISCTIDHVEYDTTYDNIFITFTDTMSCNTLDFPLKTGEEPDIVAGSGELMVGLTGGEAILKEENGDVSDLELPDFSNAVYIFNDAGKVIVFETSTDNISYAKHQLNPGHFIDIPCLKPEFIYIKLRNNIRGKESDTPYHKLFRKKGYKIKIESSDNTPSLYLDERMDILDIKK